MSFKQFTAAQRRTLAFLKALGELVVNPQDARQLKALKRRGYVRYATVEGVRVARYRNIAAERAEKRRLRSTYKWYGWPR